MQQQFSGLKIPSKTLPNERIEGVSQENHFVQSCGKGNVVGMMNVPNVNDFAKGLQVVGTINVPISSSISSTAASYATAAATIDNNDVLPSISEVRNIKDMIGVVHPIILDSQKLDMIGLPIQVETKTTAAPNVFVLLMTVEDEEEKTMTTNTSQHEANINPLDKTLTSIPEPQRSSTPKVASDDHCQIMNETIVAGFAEYHENPQKQKKDNSLKIPDTIEEVTNK